MPSNKLMYYFVGVVNSAGGVIWQSTRSHISDESGVTISFPFFSFMGDVNITKRDEIALSRTLERNGIDWIKYSGFGWTVKADGLRRTMGAEECPDWFVGEAIADTEREKTRSGMALQLVVTEESFMEQLPKRIFLSHKGTDKEMVRRYKRALEAVNLSPWLDEDVLTANMILDRGLITGMEQSCAAVFFITPNFSDENFLEDEINYAKSEKRKKGDRFSIIPLLIKGGDGTYGVVPPLLSTNVYQKIDHELDGLIAIIRAIPLQIPPPVWKV